MTEIFGAAAGALSVAGLFNNCVACFEYIQLGRHFGEDFERCQLKLDLARNRLGRWGQVVDIANNPLFQQGAVGGEINQQVCGILDNIIHQFELAYEKTKRYEVAKSQVALVLFEDNDMRPVARRLHDQLVARARRRQVGTNLIKKTTWALYDGKRLGQLLGEIKELIEELEELFPTTKGARGALVEQEIKEVGDKPSLLTLQDAATSTDELLSKAAAEKVKEIAGRNQAKDIKSEEDARVRVGNAWSDGALGSNTGITDRTENTAGSIEAKGKSGIHVGNQFGGPGIFDM